MAVRLRRPLRGGPLQGVVFHHTQFAPSLDLVPLAPESATTIRSSSRAAVTGGVDTHADIHVAAAVDQVGGVLGTASFPTTPAGYRRLLSWLRSHGDIVAVGTEGTGSCGRWTPLRARGHLGG